MDIFCPYDYLVLTPLNVFRNVCVFSYYVALICVFIHWLWIRKRRPAAVIRTPRRPATAAAVIRSSSPNEIIRIVIRNGSPAEIIRILRRRFGNQRRIPATAAAVIHPSEPPATAAAIHPSGPPGTAAAIHPRGPPATAAVVAAIQSSSPDEIVRKRRRSFGNQRRIPVIRVGADKEPWDDCCSICLEEFAIGQKLRILPSCNHAFHKKCIDLWLHRRFLCPMCRRFPFLD